MASPRTNIDKARACASRAAAWCDDIISTIDLTRNDIPPHSARGIGYGAMHAGASLAREHLRRAVAALVAAQRDGATKESVEASDAQSV